MKIICKYSFLLKKKKLKLDRTVERYKVESSSLQIFYRHGASFLAAKLEPVNPCLEVDSINLYPKQGLNLEAWVAQ